MSPIRIFVSYSHEDKRWLQQDSLIPWLARSLRGKNVELWFDREGLRAGEEFRRRIEEEIDKAHVAILLVSHGFLNSDFIQTIELPRIKTRTERRELAVIPILIEPCGWNELEFLNSRQMIPGEPTPLIDYETDREWRYVRDEILRWVSDRIRRLPDLPIATTEERAEHGLPPRTMEIWRRRTVWLPAVLILIAVILGWGWWRMKAVGTRKDRPTESQTTTLTAGAIVMNRPAGAKPGAALSEKAYAADLLFPTGSSPPGMTYATIGFTVWRTRPVTPRDGQDTAREVIDSQEMAADRVSDAIADGEKIYLGVESLTGEFLPDKGGYLYVINREQYADGTFGRSRLIFPTLLTYGGNNRVKPGQPILLPGKDRPFTVKRSSPQQAAETFSIILSPSALQLPAPLGDKAMVLDDSLFAGWEKQYGGKMYRATLRGSEGQTRTKREQSVSNREIIDEAEQSLTQGDPLPQTVFKGAVKSGSPALVTVALRFKD